MQPKVGDIVLFTFDERRRKLIEDYAPGSRDLWGQSTTVPAIVVESWGGHGNLVNLRVIPDGSGNLLWETSIPMKNDGNQDASHWEFNPVT